MISNVAETEIRRLLAEGQLSQRKIALHVGVSRGTVHAMARGKRPEHLREIRHRRRSPLITPTGPPRRCPQCGGLVQMPCLACQVRGILRSRQS